jgi:hypothetical protein
VPGSTWKRFETLSLYLLFSLFHYLYNTSDLHRPNAFLFILLSHLSVFWDHIFSFFCLYNIQKPRCKLIIFSQKTTSRYEMHPASASAIMDFPTITACNYNKVSYLTKFAETFQFFQVWVIGVHSTTINCKIYTRNIFLNYLSVEVPTLPGYPGWFEERAASWRSLVIPAWNWKLSKFTIAATLQRWAASSTKYPIYGVSLGKEDACWIRGLANRSTDYIDLHMKMVVGKINFDPVRRGNWCRCFSKHSDDQRRIDGKFKLDLHNRRWSTFVRHQQHLRR